VSERKQPKSAPIFQTDPAIPEISVGIPSATPRTGSPPLPLASLDLAGHPKCWLVVGRGRTGKTTLIRWIAEHANTMEHKVVLADLDRTNATLTSYLNGVLRAPALDDAGTVQWLQKIIGNTMANQVSTIIDLGGGDTALVQIADEVPDMPDMVHQSGAELVAAYMLGPQPDDLSPLATLRNRGFSPAATVLILNEGLLGPGVDLETGFASVQAHSVFRAAVDAGAMVVRFPRLIPASEIEKRRISFTEARDALVEPALGPFDRARIRQWLDRMDYEFAPIATWLP
jgi:hypothetical protein